MTTNDASEEQARFDQRNWTVETVKNINNNYYVTQVSDTIPDSVQILPYLADRKPQADPLSEQVIRILQSDTPRVLVCVLPGSENELHEGVMERYDKMMLRGILEEYDEKCPNTTFPMKWPDMELNPDAAIKRLKHNLLSNLTNSRKTEETDIPTELAKIRNHLSLRYNILECDWSQSEKERLDKWIDYWLTFPRLPNNRLITVFLCLHYEEEEQEKPGLLSKWFKSGSSDSMRAYVESLRKRESINLICTDDLAPLTHQHLVKWSLNVCPCVTDKLDVGRLHSLAIKLCPRNTAKPLAELYTDMCDAVEAAYKK